MWRTQSHSATQWDGGDQAQLSATRSYGRRGRSRPGAPVAPVTNGPAVGEKISPEMSPFSIAVERLLNDLAPLTDPSTVLQQQVRFRVDSRESLYTPVQNIPYPIMPQDNQGKTLITGNPAILWDKKQRQAQLLLQLLPSEEQQILYDVLAAEPQQQECLLQLLQKAIETERRTAAGAAARQEFVASAAAISQSLKSEGTSSPRALAASTARNNPATAESDGDAFRQSQHQSSVAEYLSGGALSTQNNQLQAAATYTEKQLGSRCSTSARWSWRTQQRANRLRVHESAAAERAETRQQQLLLQEELLLRKKLVTRLHALLSQLPHKQQQRTMLAGSVNAGVQQLERGKSASRSYDDATSPLACPAPFQPAYFPHLAGTIAQCRMQLPGANSNEGSNDNQNAAAKRPSPRFGETEDSVVARALKDAEESLLKEKEETFSIMTAVNTFLQAVDHPEDKATAVGEAENAFLHSSERSQWHAGDRDAAAGKEGCSAESVKITKTDNQFSSSQLVSKFDGQHQQLLTLQQKLQNLYPGEVSERPSMPLQRQYVATHKHEEQDGTSFQLSLILQQLVNIQQQIMQQQVLLESCQIQHQQQGQPLQQAQQAISSAMNKEPVLLDGCLLNQLQQQLNPTSKKTQREREQQTDRLEGLSRLSSLLQQSYQLQRLLRDQTSVVTDPAEHSLLITDQNQQEQMRRQLPECQQPKILYAEQQEAYKHETDKDGHAPLLAQQQKRHEQPWKHPTVLSAEQKQLSRVYKHEKQQAATGQLPQVPQQSQQEETFDSANVHASRSVNSYKRTESLPTLHASVELQQRAATSIYISTCQHRQQQHQQKHQEKQGKQQEFVSQSQQLQQKEEQQKDPHELNWQQQCGAPQQLQPHQLRPPYMLQQQQKPHQQGIQQQRPKQQERHQECEQHREEQLQEQLLAKHKLTRPQQHDVTHEKQQQQQHNKKDQQHQKHLEAHQELQEGERSQNQENGQRQQQQLRYPREHYHILREQWKKRRCLIDKEKHQEKLQLWQQQRSRDPPFEGILAIHLEHRSNIPHFQPEDNQKRPTGSTDALQNEKKKQTPEETLQKQHASTAIMRERPAATVAMGVPAATSIDRLEASAAEAANSDAKVSSSLSDKEQDVIGKEKIEQPLQQNWPLNSQAHEEKQLQEIRHHENIPEKMQQEEILNLSHEYCEPSGGIRLDLRRRSLSFRGGRAPVDKTPPGTFNPKPRSLTTFLSHEQQLQPTQKRQKLSPIDHPSSRKKDDCNKKIFGSQSKIQVETNSAVLSASRTPRGSNGKNEQQKHGAHDESISHKLAHTRQQQKTALTGAKTAERKGRSPIRSQSVRAPNEQRHLPPSVHVTSGKLEPSINSNISRKSSKTTNFRPSLQEEGSGPPSSSLENLLHKDLLSDGYQTVILSAKTANNGDGSRDGSKPTGLPFSQQKGGTSSVSPGLIPRGSVKELAEKSHRLANYVILPGNRSATKRAYSHSLTPNHGHPSALSSYGATLPLRVRSSTVTQPSVRDSSNSSRISRSSNSNKRISNSKTNSLQIYKERNSSVSPPPKKPQHSPLGPHRERSPTVSTAANCRNGSKHSTTKAQQDTTNPSMRNSATGISKRLLTATNILTSSSSQSRVGSPKGTSSSTFTSSQQQISAADGNCKLHPLCNAAEALPLPRTESSLEPQGIPLPMQGPPKDSLKKVIFLKPQSGSRLGHKNQQPTREDNIYTGEEELWQESNNSTKAWGYCVPTGSHREVENYDMIRLISALDETAPLGLQPKSEVLPPPPLEAKGQPLLWEVVWLQHQGSRSSPLTQVVEANSDGNSESCLGLLNSNNPQPDADKDDTEPRMDRPDTCFVERQQNKVTQQDMLLQTNPAHDQIGSHSLETLVGLPTAASSTRVKNPGAAELRLSRSTSSLLRAAGGSYHQGLSITNFPVRDFSGSSTGSERELPSSRMSLEPATSPQTPIAPPTIPFTKPQTLKDAPTGDPLPGEGEHKLWPRESPSGKHGICNSSTSRCGDTATSSMPLALFHSPQFGETTARTATGAAAAAAANVCSPPSTPPAHELIAYRHPSYRSIRSITGTATRQWSPAAAAQHTTDEKNIVGSVSLQPVAALSSSGNGEGNGGGNGETAAPASWKAKLLSLPRRLVQSFLNPNSSSSSNHSNSNNGNSFRQHPQDPWEKGHTVRDGHKEAEIAQQEKGQPGSCQIGEFFINSSSSSSNSGGEALCAVDNTSSCNATEVAGSCTVAVAAPAGDANRPFSTSALQDQTICILEAQELGPESNKHQKQQQQQAQREDYWISVSKQSPPFVFAESTDSFTKPPFLPGETASAVAGGQASGQASFPLMQQLSDGKVPQRPVVDTGLFVVAVPSLHLQQQQQLSCLASNAAATILSTEQAVTEKGRLRFDTTNVHFNSTAALNFRGGKDITFALPAALNSKQQQPHPQTHEALTPRFVEERNVATEKPSTPSETCSSEHSSGLQRGFLKSPQSFLTPQASKQGANVGRQLPSVIPTGTLAMQQQHEPAACSVLLCKQQPSKLALMEISQQPQIYRPHGHQQKHQHLPAQPHALRQEPLPPRKAQMLPEVLKQSSSHETLLQQQPQQQQSGKQRSQWQHGYLSEQLVAGDEEPPEYCSNRSRQLDLVATVSATASCDSHDSGSTPTAEEGAEVSCRDPYYSSDRATAACFEMETRPAESACSAGLHKAPELWEVAPRTARGPPDAERQKLYRAKSLSNMEAATPLTPFLFELYPETKAAQQHQLRTRLAAVTAGAGGFPDGHQCSRISSDGFGILTQEVLRESLHQLNITGHLTEEELQALLASIEKGSCEVYQAVLTYCLKGDPVLLMETLKDAASTLMTSMKTPFPKPDLLLEKGRVV